MSETEVIFLSGKAVKHISDKLAEETLAEMDYSQEFAKKHLTDPERSFGQNVANLTNLINVALMESPLSSRRELAFCICQMIQECANSSVALNIPGFNEKVEKHDA